MAGISTYFSITALNIHSLNLPIKRQTWRMAQKNKSYIYVVCEKHTGHLQRNTGWKSVNGKMIIQGRVPILTSDKVDFKLKLSEVKKANINKENN